MTRELLSFICHLDRDMPNGQARRQWVSSFSERCDMCQGMSWLLLHVENLLLAQYLE